MRQKYVLDKGKYSAYHLPQQEGESHWVVSLFWADPLLCSDRLRLTGQLSAGGAECQLRVNRTRETGEDLHETYRCHFRFSRNPVRCLVVSTIRIGPLSLCDSCSWPGCDA